MPSSGEQAGWVAVGVAFVAAAAQIIDRLIARWRPGARAARHRRPDTGEQLEHERASLAKEWEEYREAINRQLADCRASSAAQAASIERLTTENVALRLHVGVLTARMREHGIEVGE